MQKLIVIEFQAFFPLSMIKKLLIRKSCVTHLKKKKNGVNDEKEDFSLMKPFKKCL